MNGVKFLYVPANDLDAMREFYTERIGLQEIYFQAGEGIGYNCDGFQFTVLGAGGVTTIDHWATQPGWTGDTSPLISWSVEMNESGLRRAIAQTRAAADQSLYEAPQWVGYWSYPVKDPMGNTVELTWPEDRSGHPGQWPTPSR